MVVDRRDRRSLALLGAWVAACAVAFGVVYQGTVRTLSGRQFADASLRGAILSRSSTEDLVDRTLGVVTVASLLAALAVIAVIALLRLRRGIGLAAVGVLALSNLSAQLLKGLLERPDLGLREYAPATLNSLPSGHSTAAFSVVVALLLVVPARTRGGVAAVGGTYACVIALATMAAGWHRTADSVASFLLVGFWAGIALAGVVLFEGGDIEPGAGTDDSRRRRRSLATAATLALGLGAALMTMLIVADPFRESTFGEVTAFATGVLFVIASSIGVLVSILVLIERMAPAADGAASGPHGASQAPTD